MVGSAVAMKGFWTQVIQGKGMANRATASYDPAIVTPPSKHSYKRDDNDTWVLLEAGCRRDKAAYPSNGYAAHACYEPTGGDGFAIPENAVMRN